MKITILFGGIFFSELFPNVFINNELMSVGSAADTFNCPWTSSHWHCGGCRNESV
jgi:hypothetical protein